MKTAPNLNLKKKKSSQNKKTKKADKWQCIWCFLSNHQKYQNRNNSTPNDPETTSPTAENIEETLEVVSPTKIRQRARIIRIPKIGCIVPYLTRLFDDLCNSGVVCMDGVQMVQAINIIVKAKKDFDEGIQWNGNIEIYDNIKMKLYKSGLVLYIKI